MNGLKLAPHEQFELHELMTLKSVGATKAAAMKKFVTDEGLGELLHGTLITAQDQLDELKDFMRIAVGDISRDKM